MRDQLAKTIMSNRAVDNWAEPLPSDFDLADAIIAALPDMVQPLVFENRQSNDGLLNYRIHIGYGLMNGIFALTCNGSTIGEFGSEAEAEKFADTHNRNRILSAFGITGET